VEANECLEVREMSVAQAIVPRDDVVKITAAALASLRVEPFGMLWEAAAKQHLLRAAMHAGYGAVSKDTNDNYYAMWYIDQSRGFNYEKLNTEGRTVDMADHCDLALVQKPLDRRISVADVQVKVVPAIGSKSQVNTHKCALTAEDLQSLYGGHKGTGGRGRLPYEHPDPRVSAVVVLVHCLSREGAVDLTPINWLAGTHPEGRAEWRVAPCVTCDGWLESPTHSDVWAREHSMQLGTQRHYTKSAKQDRSFITLTGSRHSVKGPVPVSVCCTTLRTTAAIAFDGKAPEGPDLYAFVYSRPDA
jgi:hypothetical protein